MLFIYCRIELSIDEYYCNVPYYFDLDLSVERTIEMELASGAVVEEQVYRGSIHFDGRTLPVEIILTDAEDSFIGTGVLTGKVLLINFATREVTIQDHPS